jgi:hypothetical protein
LVSSARQIKKSQDYRETTNCSAEQAKKSGFFKNRLEVYHFFFWGGATWVRGDPTVLVE